MGSILNWFLSIICIFSSLSMMAKPISPLNVLLLILKHINPVEIENSSFWFMRVDLVIVGSKYLSAYNCGISHMGSSTTPLSGWMPTMMVFSMSNPSAVTLAPVPSLLFGLRTVMSKKPSQYPPHPQLMWKRSLLSYPSHTNMWPPAFEFP